MANPHRLLGVNDIPGAKQAPLKALDLSFRCNDQKFILSGIVKHDKIFSGSVVFYEFHSE